MHPLISRVLVIAGSAVVLIAMFLPWVSFLGEDLTGWQVMRRTDVAITLLTAATLVLAILVTVMRNRVIALLIAPLAGAAFGLTAYVGIEGFAEKGSAIGMYLALFASLTALVGAVLLELGEAGVIATPAPGGPPAAQQPPPQPPPQQ